MVLFNRSRTVSYWSFVVTMSIYCTVLEILPLICELIAYVIINDLGNYFRSNTADELSL